MSDRMTRTKLEGIVVVLNKEIPGHDFSIGGAYGGYRLERKKQSVDVSPRGTKQECYDYIRAMLEGVTLYRRYTDVGDMTPKAISLYRSLI